MLFFFLQFPSTMIFWLECIFLSPKFIFSRLTKMPCIAVVSILLIAFAEKLHAISTIYYIRSRTREIQQLYAALQYIQFTWKSSRVVIVLMLPPTKSLIWSCRLNRFVALTCSTHRNNQIWESSRSRGFKFQHDPRVLKASTLTHFRIHNLISWFGSTITSIVNGELQIVRAHSQ